ncbi:MAG: hypothetical protein KKC11_05790 [Candidatus Omnitrophica bacterium]|nr:hypothetical protein [Candidatus Omnitrophota bacterium]MBU0896235.1 hypothetical protein [Candidatus Omnitrophota bacterium]MBU1133301.1 hypothetical protein [Candidatus Omnitrophota bacterium]MBU1367442.1 hypothetical protein [Candidatus Omnitrophota bacterium]MBU1524166.1 hypothetical protein [Candidatus Omnitrophota bacterium]
MKFPKRLRIKKLREIIANNFWLKIISLIVAVVIWLYVNGEIIRGIRV